MKELFSISTRKGVITLGVISSLITTFILKYSSHFLDWLGTSSLSIITKFIDSRIKKAATLESTDYSYFLIIFVFVIAAIVWWGVTGAINKKLLQQSAECQNLKEPQKQELDRSSKILLKAGTYLIWIYFLLGFFYLFGDVFTKNAITDFRHHMRILAPYMTEHQKDEIISQWSLMQRFDEYQAVYKKLNEVAGKNKIQLKPNHMY